MHRLISFLGIFILIAIAWACSTDRKRIPIQLVIWGVVLQFVFCLLVLGIPALGIAGPLRFCLRRPTPQSMRRSISLSPAAALCSVICSTPRNSASFLRFRSYRQLFLWQPMSVLYHIGVMQKVTYFFAIIMQKTMKTSGAETLAAFGEHLCRAN